MDDLPSELRDAIGRVEVSEESVCAAPVAAMMATLGRQAPPPQPGDALPETWHGLFCTAKLPPWRLNPDGLSKEETLLPSLDEFPRRMFGGARYSFHRPIRIGETMRKESAIASAELKRGRSGAFVVAVVHHRILGPNGLATLEENDILFRPDSGPPQAAPGGAAGPPPASATAAWRQTITPDPVLMFRASALTFNSHRIHYDRDWAVKVEGYPGLVVMGSLIARVLLELLWREMPAVALASFAFRSGRPLFDTAPFSIGGAPAADGRSAKLWALDAEGVAAMTAEATFKS